MTVKHPIIDLHMHVVPAVDDGAVNMAMALEMLALAYEQGVRGVFCTSHSDDVAAEVGQYHKQYRSLKEQAAKQFADLTLYSGCEVYCTEYNKAAVLAGLKAGEIPTLNKSRYVLTEFSPQADADTVLSFSDAVISAGYIPIIAHAERCAAFEAESTAHRIADRGGYIQANAYSFSGERNAAIMNRARRMLREHTMHFIGSDAHRSSHRPPNIINGINYIYNHTDEKYAEEICCKNAIKYLI